MVMGTSSSCQRLRITNVCLRRGQGVLMTGGMGAYATSSTLCQAEEADTAKEIIVASVLEGHDSKATVHSYPLRRVYLDQRWTQSRGSMPVLRSRNANYPAVLFGHLTFAQNIIDIWMARSQTSRRTRV